MNITKAMKEKATDRMVATVFHPLFDELANDMNAFSMEVYNQLIKPGADKAVATGVDAEFLRKTSRITIRYLDLKNNACSLIWAQSLIANMYIPDVLTVNSYGRRHTIQLDVDQLIVPARWVGDIQIDQKDKSTKNLSESFLALNKRSRKLTDEADEYHKNISNILSPLRTLKTLEQVFPAAVRFMPIPAPKKQELAPVELINNITKRLHQGEAGAAA